MFRRRASHPHFTSAMADQVTTPTFQEALKQDKAQFDDCTPCRVVGMLAPAPRPCTARDSHLTTNTGPRQRNLCGPRRFHLRVWPLATQSTRSSHSPEQDRLWHGQSTSHHHHHFGRLCRLGRVPLVCMTWADRHPKHASIRASRPPQVISHTMNSCSSATPASSPTQTSV